MTSAASAAATSAATASTPEPSDRDLHGPAGGLRGGDRLQRRAIELAVAVFGDDEDHSALASSRRRLTSSFAASAGVPESICVFLPFSGK